jgi:hypothetical protein
MIEARARRPRSVTGSARPDAAEDDADIDLVYRRPMPQRAIGWVAPRASSSG